MHKRVIAILLIAALLPTLIVPASASDLDSTTPAGTQYINYLTAGEYFVDDVSQSSPFYEPYSSFTKLNLRFTPLDLSAANYTIFCFIAKTQPASVNVRYSSGGQLHEAAFEGLTAGGDGYTYFYYRAEMDFDAKYIDVDINYSSPYSDQIRLLSCFGVRKLLDSFGRVNFNVVTKEDGPEGIAVEKRTNIGLQDLPYTYRNDTTTDLNSADFTLSLDSDRFDTSAVDRVSLLLTTYCERITVTASLVAKDASVQNVSNLKVNLTTDKEWGLVNNYETGAGTVYNYLGYQIDVDLHGYDLQKYELFFYVSLDPVLYVNSSSVSNTRLLEVTFRSLNYVPTVITTPWYISFFNDFTFSFENISLQLEALLNSVSYYWSDFFGMWDTRWDSLMTKLDEYFGGDDELSGQEGEMKEQSSQLQQANDAMNSVEKPSIDTGAMLDQYLNFNPTGLAILSVITNNPFATAMLVVIFTFALCGYIFFGKKR